MRNHFLISDINAWQYSGLVSIQTPLTPQCCTALCSGKSCPEANSDKCIKSDNNTHGIALQTLSGRLMCVVVGHLSSLFAIDYVTRNNIFPTSPESGGTLSDTYNVSPPKRIFTNELRTSVHAQTHTHRNRNILHIP